MNFKYFIFVCLCFLTSCAAIKSLIPFVSEAAVEIEEEVSDEIKKVEAANKTASTTGPKAVKQPQK